MESALIFTTVTNKKKWMATLKWIGYASSFWWLWWICMDFGSNLKYFSRENKWNFDQFRYFHVFTHENKWILLVEWGKIPLKSKLSFVSHTMNDDDIPIQINHSNCNIRKSTVESFNSILQTGSKNSQYIYFQITKHNNNDHLDEHLLCVHWTIQHTCGSVV